MGQHRLPSLVDGWWSVSGWQDPMIFLGNRVLGNDTRLVNSSWALFQGASVREIQRAVYLVNPNSFISCYLKDVVLGEALLGRAVLSVGRKERVKKKSVPSGAC